MTTQIDPRAIALGVYVVDNPVAKWKIVKIDYQDETQAQGRHNIYYLILDKDGHPAPNILAYMDWKGRNPKQDPPTKGITDGNGEVNFGMYANLDTTKKNGAYFSFVGSQVNSDVVYGMGLPEHHHVNFVLTFQEQVAVTPPVPPQPPPTPPPPVPTPTGQWVITEQTPATATTPARIVLELH